MGTVLTAGETPVCLVGATGKGCTIQDVQAVTQNNFCAGDSATVAFTASDSSSSEAGSISENEASPEYDYEDYGGFDSDDAEEYRDDGVDQEDAHEESLNDTYSEDDDDNDDESNAADSNEESEHIVDSSGVGCNRLQDFQSLVDHAAFEYQKEQIEGHIRSNSLVFNTFIFLQVSAASMQSANCCIDLSQLSILLANSPSCALAKKVFCMQIRLVMCMQTRLVMCMQIRLVMCMQIRLVMCIPCLNKLCFRLGASSGVCHALERLVASLYACVEAIPRRSNLII